MRDIEKAINQARQQNLAQGKVKNKSHDAKARSTNIPEIRKAENVPEFLESDMQAEDTDKSADYAHDKHPQVLIEFKNAVNGASNSESDDTKSRTLNVPVTHTVDDQLARSVDGQFARTIDDQLAHTVDGQFARTIDDQLAHKVDGQFARAVDDQLESVGEVTELDDEKIPRNSAEFQQAINGDKNAKYKPANGHCDLNFDSLDDYDAIYCDSKFDATNGDSNSKYKGTKIAARLANRNTQVCVLPFEKMRSAGFITPDLQKGKLTEEYRRIKRPLLKNMGRKAMDNSSKNVIAVTSSVSGEGKTYSSVNLAMSIALEKERNVLLVDADTVKGAAGSLFSIPQDQPGLTDLLSDDSIDVADVIMKTNADNLSFMPCGMMRPHTHELLASDVMGDLIVELARRYNDRIIILDCPPILQTNEANILVDRAGQVVFVVAEEDTRQNQVLNAIDQIDNGKYVGVLVNKSSKL